MADEKGDLRNGNLRQMFPTCELLRAFWIALDPSKLLLATLAVVLVWFSWWLLYLIFTPEHNEFGQWPAHAPRGVNPFVVLSEKPGDLFTSDFWLGTSPGGSDKAGVEIRQPPVHLEPFQKLLRPLFDLFKSNPGHLRWWYLLFGVLFTVVIWAVFGGAITRIAAVQYARNEKIGMTEAIRFAFSKFIHFVTAPLIPFGVLAFVALLMFLGGLLLNAPYLGDVLVSLLWVLPLLGALGMAIALLGYVGWPLMYATISAEGSDNFDALSRSYIYVFSKPLHYLWYSAVSVVFGMVVTFFVVFFTSLVVYLAQWGVGLAAGANWREADPVKAMSLYAPSSYEWDRLLQEGRAHDKLSPEAFQEAREKLKAGMGAGQYAAAGITAFWLHLIFLLTLGFAYSFFWSSSTIIYFLMRKKVDDTEPDEVYLEEEEPPAYTPPPATFGAPAPAGTSAPPTATLPMVEPPKVSNEPPSSPPA
jgi:hypothetical protein